jgi:trimeric autotransporter adhesin
MKKSFLFIVIFFFPFVGITATYTVINTNDSGAGSLRQAIIDANAVPGPDNIYFNIPTSDANYSASTGVWTITLSTALPMVSGGYTDIDASSQTTNQGNTNTQGPEIVLDGGNTLTYAFQLVSPNNTIKGFVIGQFEYGIQVYGTIATNTSINDNYIGTDRTGTIAFSNQYGIGLSGAVTTVSINNNVISGNTVVGIASSPANNLTITGNMIGVDITGMNALPNPMGILLDNTYSCTIGGNTIAKRNIISGNTDAGIVINDLASTSNIVIGNYIGVNKNCSDTIPNGNGVMIVSASNNTIGGTSVSSRNIISGNVAMGVLINGTGANNNSIIGNYIGIDSSGTIAMSNHHGVIIKGDADNNIVGGDAANERNIISANLEIGVYIEASDSNVVSGNYIGTDYLGTSSFYFGTSDTLLQANGVEINTLSKHNIIGGNTIGERNIISGNRVYGAIYYGNVSENNICGNYIGTDVSGSFAIPNATGICVDDASNHNMMENNLLSGNISYGLFIVTTGSYYNVFRGNLVGTNATGTDTIPNDVGLLIAGGAKYNYIGGTTAADRNIFSGNRYGGIEIADNGTDYNEIIGNYIGVDITGNTAMPNAIGIGIGSLSTASVIDSNIISGNTTFGLILTDATDSNLVVNNFIGLAADAVTDLGNGASGIVIGQGATNNSIGEIGKGNTIAFNDSAGIVIVDNATIQNNISANSIYSNSYLGIEILPAGVNANDANDIDVGPNQLMNFPVISTTGYNSISGTTYITGTIDTQNPENCTVEVFKSAADVVFNHGEGKTYLGSTTPDNLGNWAIVVSAVVANDTITATATDANGNTSEFALNSSIVVGMEENELFHSILVYPNPSNGICYISYTLETASYIEISLFDIRGQKMQSLFQGVKMEHDNMLNFNTKEYNSGLYFLTIKANNKIIGIKKIEIIK